MTISHTPSPARNDVLPGAVTASAAETRPFRLHGRMLSLGAAAWAVSTAIYGTNPTDTVGLVVFGIGSGLFQVGLLFLLRVLWRTQALGTGRIARAALRVESVLVSLAIASTFVDTIQVSDLDRLGWLLLDLNWPLSMLGMLLIAVRIAIAGRWTGLSRYWPLVAESWALVVIPSFGILGADIAKYVSTVHLLVGYTVLGVLVARKER